MTILYEERTNEFRWINRTTLQQKWLTGTKEIPYWAKSYEDTRLDKACWNELREEWRDIPNFDLPPSQ